MTVLWCAPGVESVLLTICFSLPAIFVTEVVPVSVVSIHRSNQSVRVISTVRLVSRDRDKDRDR